MGKTVTAEMIRSRAALIDLELPEEEVIPVMDRLQALMDGSAQIVHLTDNTAELDLRFNANWEDESA